MFNKSLIIDIGIQSMASVSTNTVNKKSQNTPLKRCFVCDCMLPLQKMRTHVGWHIVHGNLAGSLHPCGFCGKDTCQNTFEETSMKKSTPFYKVKSICAYFVELARKPTKANMVNPCSNYLEKCSICKHNVWKYNMPQYFQRIHPDIEQPKID